MQILTSTTNIVEFVQCWSEIYGRKVLVEDMYDGNINIGGNLTKRNIHPLFMWKFHSQPVSYKRYVEKLSDPIVLKYINDFRKKNSVKNKDILEFNDFIVQNQLVETGSVIRAFIIHLGNPFQIPILDQHVIRTYDSITGKNFSPHVNFSDFLEKNYLEYRTYILDLSKQTGFPIRTIYRAFWFYGFYIQ